MLDALGPVSKCEFDTCPLRWRDVAMNRTPEEVLIGEVASIGAACTPSVQDEVQGIKNGSLATAIEGVPAANAGRSTAKCPTRSLRQNISATPTSSGVR